ncbi:facilitated trehalose transporter Tret1-like isoform X2 [Prorops nasuta]|uniref:facilitated trehalose transporter Tret1-like isoform X2 n=1 Tax=Prorops nasuta TaxID=863751 RepID=UPI0034CEE4D8
MGMTVGWVEPSLVYFLLPKKYHNSTHIRDNLQWTMNLGAGFGALVPLAVIDYFGRKTSFQNAAVINLVAEFLLIGASNKTMFMAAAFLGGCAVGIFFTGMVLYVAEISTPAERGTVGALVSFCAYIGIVFTDLIAIFLNWQILIYAICLATLTFIASMSFWMIESPHFLLMEGKSLETKLTLKSLRGVGSILEIEEEYKSMESFLKLEQDSQRRPSLRSIFWPERVKKSVAIILPILCISQMVGGHAMDDYAEEVVNIVVPHYGKLLLSSLDVLSVGICLYMIDKVGRKPLLMISIIGSGLCCFSLAIFRYFGQDQCRSINNKIEISVGIVIVYYSVYSLGLIPILPILTGELFPSRIKTIAVGLCMAFVYLAAAGMQSLYWFFYVRSGTCLAFAAFAMSGSLGCPLAVTSMPETKGKSLYEIQGEIESIAVVMS